MAASEEQLWDTREVNGMPLAFSLYIRAPLASDMEKNLRGTMKNRTVRYIRKKASPPYPRSRFARQPAENSQSRWIRVVFRLENIDVPCHFSQVASDIRWRRKYFRKAGVPSRLKKKWEENSVPSSYVAVRGREAAWPIYRSTNNLVRR